MPTAIIDLAPATAMLVGPIRERFSLVLAYMYSRKPINDVLEKHFDGPFKHLYYALEYTEETARRSMIEAAAFTRLVDDEQNWSPAFGKISLGTVFFTDDRTEALLLRDFTNKVLHAAGFAWDFSDPDNPVFVCIGASEERWARAEVTALGLMRVCALTA